MKTRLILCVATLGFVTSGADAQSEGVPEPEPCDFATWFNSPGGVATQPSHDEITGTWDCNADQPVIDYIWRGFNVTYVATGANHGFEDPCNPVPPVGRTLNAALLLGYSHSNSPNCDVSQNNILDWALCFSASRITETNLSCGAGTAFATTVINPFSSKVIFWPQGLYHQDVAGLAATMIHEARHWDCSHNGGSDCERGKSCDDNWEDGCPWPNNGHGANRFQVAWLAWYANQGIRGGTPLKKAASVRANEILGSAFTNVPCFTLASDGTPMRVQGPGCM